MLDVKNVEYGGDSSFAVITAFCFPVINFCAFMFLVFTDSDLLDFIIGHDLSNSWEWN